MYREVILFLVCFSTVNAGFASFKNLGSYAKIFNFDGLLANGTGNELWHGLFRDCRKKVTFSCIQKNTYTYLDNVFVERDNITVFDGFVLTKNNLDYGTCERRNDVDENLVEGSGDCENPDGDGENDGREFSDDPESPLEEVTNALRRKSIKFLATRDYEVQLPEFFFEGAIVKVSPREVDENGALLRVDFSPRAQASEGRILFKKFKKFIQNKLLTSFLALLLIIKLIKLKFMFIIPFLFGVGTAKKLFLKLLLFFIPAFAHVFKLCSSFYSHHSTKYHHHHHQIAHHHHHVPVPVPVPTYHDNHHHHHEDDFDGYDYAHPHIQYRKDIEELKEWGIEPYEESYADSNQPSGSPVRSPGVVPGNMPGVVVQGNVPGVVVQGVVPGIVQAPLSGQSFAGNYGVPQYAVNARPVAQAYQEKRPAALSAHNLAYSGYLDEKFNRRNSVQQSAASSASNVPINPNNLLPANSQASTTSLKNSYGVFAQQNTKQAQKTPQSTSKTTILQRQSYDDEYYGPIIERLETIFNQLRFFEESCRERLICSMYKTPAIFSPHSNLVSNELSRDPQELKRGVTESTSSQKFNRYLSSARLGQDGGDCMRTYPCHINTE